MNNGEKYVWCLPMGGFNDLLCQIGRCVDYSIKHNRVLVLEDIWDIKFDWSLGLELSVSNGESVKIVKKTPDIFEKIKSLRFFPVEVPTYNILDSTVYSFVNNDYRFKDSGIAVTFDFNNTYDEDVLVYQQHGGGNLSHQTIKYFKVTAAVAEKIKSLRKVHKNYIAVHIRNTDYTSDYLGLLHQINKEVTTGKILVCSDNAKVKLDAEGIFKEKYLSVVDIPVHNGIGTALQFNEKNTNEFVVSSTLIELCMLAYSDKLIKCPISGYSIHASKSIPEYSGFALLADFLHKNRDVLDAFAQQEQQQT